jgi:hypothetical protein
MVDQNHLFEVRLCTYGFVLDLPIWRKKVIFSLLIMFFNATFKANKSF